MKTGGPPSVAIRVVAILPSNDEISAAGSGEVADGVAAAGPGVAAMAAISTSALATAASVAVGGGATGVSALASARLLAGDMAQAQALHGEALAITRGLAG